MRFFSLRSIILFSLAALISCTSQNTHRGDRPPTEENGGADRIEAYTLAIQNPQDSRELFRSHFRRAEAHREAGNAEMAFQDYYSAKIVSCWLEKNERFSRWRKSAGMIPSTYCRQWADQRMATVSSGIPPERQAALKLEAETALSRYLLK